ncbi:B9 domain-containing protein [Pelagophyceae sp. CCMP2097]|nr:B9 domain-containing protein [Pelagophyceae sp. CCMP2097]
MESGPAPSGFYIVVNGQIESAEFAEDDLYVRYGFSFGADWTIVDGVETGLSQIARKNTGADQTVVWNFPIDIAFKSTNAFGWPRMSISVYGVDQFGRDVVRGYGSVLIPTYPGAYVRYAHVYTPVPSSLWQRLSSWFSGSHAEFYDSKFVTRGEHRDVTRVQFTGVVKVKLDVVTRGMGAIGFSPASATTHDD